MKIVIKKEDEKIISDMSDKPVATIKSVDDKHKEEKKPKNIPLVRPGAADGSLLKRNINMFIIILIIIFICGGVAVAVLYMNIIKNVSGQKDTFKDNFTTCHTSLENYMETLSMTQNELNSTSEDIKKYDTLYAEKATALETTQNDLQKTQTDLASTKALLDTTIGSLKKANADVASLTTERNNLQTQVDTLKPEVASLNNLVDSLERQLNNCK